MVHILYMGIALRVFLYIKNPLTLPFISAITLYLIAGIRSFSLLVHYRGTGQWHGLITVSQDLFKYQLTWREVYPLHSQRQGTLIITSIPETNRVSSPSDPTSRFLVFLPAYDALGRGTSTTSMTLHRFSRILP